MIWKKSFFSYFMWLLYTLAVGSSLICTIILFGNERSYSLPVSLFWGGACLIMAGGFVFGMRCLRKKIEKNTVERKLPCFIPEGIAAVLLLAVGIVLCVNDFPRTCVGAEYYELAKVTDRQGVIQVVHGAVYFYLHMLHIICIFFGNKITACMTVQMILYVITAITLYFAVRRLAGVLPALVSLAFMVLSPFLTKGAKLLAPGILFLFFYAVSLHFIATCLKKRNGMVLKYLLAGVVIAFTTYLDVMGLTLLAFVISLFYVQKANATKTWNKPVVAVALCLLAAVAGFFGCLALDAFFSHKDFYSVLCAWGNLYAPKEFRLLPLSYEQNMTWDSVLLLALLTLGIFSFFCRKKVEKLSVWIFAALLLILMEGFQITTPEMTAVFYLYIFLAVMAGINIENIFAREENAFCPQEALLQEKEIILNETLTDEKTVNEKTENENTINEKREETTVQFIENPLPLPKKHVAKTMDYKINKVENVEMDFDYAIDDSDDYDI